MAMRTSRSLDDLIIGRIRETVKAMKTCIAAVPDACGTDTKRIYFLFGEPVKGRAETGKGSASKADDRWS
jgi:hypothetical protein